MPNLSTGDRRSPYILARQIRGYPAHFSNVPEKLFVARTVQQLLTVLDQLQESDSGEFFPMAVGYLKKKQCLARVRQTPSLQ